MTKESKPCEPRTLAERTYRPKLQPRTVSPLVFSLFQFFFFLFQAQMIFLDFFWNRSFIFRKIVVNRFQKSVRSQYRTMIFYRRQAAQCFGYFPTIDFQRLFYGFPFY